MLVIKLLLNGPILLDNGNSKLALCRCGLSNNKPLCDGSHKGCKLPEAEVKMGESVEVKP